MSVAEPLSADIIIMQTILIATMLWIFSDQLYSNHKKGDDVILTNSLNYERSGQAAKQYQDFRLKF